MALAIPEAEAAVEASADTLDCFVSGLGDHTRKY